jgi:hypothetical protein
MILCEWDAQKDTDRRFGLVYPSDRRGFAGPKKKTIVSLLLFNPLWRRLTSVYFRDNQYFLYGSAKRLRITIKYMLVLPVLSAVQ